MCSECLECFLPQPLTAGGGDVVVLAASVDGCLDFSLAALWGDKGVIFGVTVLFFTASFWDQCMQGNQPA